MGGNAFVPKSSDCGTHFSICNTSVQTSSYGSPQRRVFGTVKGDTGCLELADRRRAKVPKVEVGTTPPGVADTAARCDYSRSFDIGFEYCIGIRPLAKII